LKILNQPALWVAVVSGVLGFRAGYLNFPDWQVAVETAQVTAGLVSYPADNPTFIYHVKLWTLLHQALALALRAGAGEIRLSLVVSGVVGMLSFQAIALAVYAVGRQALLAIAAGFVIFLGAATDFGVTYPVLLLGTPHTYGSAGLALVVIVAALFGAGALRAGAFLLGVAPAVHPSLGAWLFVLIGITGAWDWWSRRTGAAAEREAAALWTAGRWFAAGCVVTAISLGVHLLSMPDLPPADSADASRYIAAFFESWDGHRQPVNFGAPGVLLNGLAAVLALCWLTVFGRDLSRGRAFLLRFILVCSAVSVGFGMISHLPADSLPLPLMILMPTRLLNINLLLFPALVFGLFVMYRHTIWAAIALPVLTAAIAIGDRSYVWREIADRHPGWVHRLDLPRPDTLLTLELAAVAVVLCVAMARLVHSGVLKPRAGRTATRASLVVTLGILVWAAGSLAPLRRPTQVIFRDRTNSSFFYFVGQHPGMLLTGGNLYLVQLRTRRPVLLNGGGLDGLAYAMESASGMSKILSDVYGVDLLNPPAEARGIGAVPNEANRVVWEGYTRERWRTIRQAYGVTQVFTYRGWTLDLPVAASDASGLLYDIPE
jgi:hypothetical protein